MSGVLWSRKNDREKVKNICSMKDFTH